MKERFPIQFLVFLSSDVSWIFPGEARRLTEEVREAQRRYAREAKAAAGRMLGQAPAPGRLQRLLRLLEPCLPCSEKGEGLKSDGRSFWENHRKTIGK